MAIPYTYTKLRAGEIRILQLQPRLDTTILQCNLNNVPLKNSKQSFVALSWTWGKEPKPEEHAKINLNGKEFSIWPNLYEALSALRKNDETLPLWIDAICIDQKNPEERDQQIPLMDAIYTLASEVYVWLGGAANDSDYIIETLRSNNEEDYSSHRFALGLYEMLLRPWWTRTWIVQEYVLNKTSPQIFCGQGAGVSAELLLDVWRRDSVSQQISQDLFNRRANILKLSSRYLLYSLRDSRHNPHGEYLKRNLRNALYWLRSFEVTNPRDKIYGALGLIEPKWREQFLEKPGVHTDQSAANVYHDATIYLLQCEKSSTIYYDFAVGRHSHSALPSWVPDFNLDTNSRALSPIRLGDVTSNHLDAIRKDIEISKDRLRLHTQGLIVDQIDELIVVEDRSPETMDRNKVFSNTFNLLLLLHRIRTLVRGLHSYKECEVLSEPLWKTLIAGCYGSIEDEDLKDKQGCQMQFEEFMAIPLDAILNNITTIPLDTIMDYVMTLPGDAIQNLVMTILKKTNESPLNIHKIGNTLWPGRAFFSGEQGSYGISENGARGDDIVALLFPEHFVPFILRKVDDCFEMVGVAYIPEPFKEATIKKYREDGRTLQDFVII